MRMSNTKLRDSSIRTIMVLSRIRPSIELQRSPARGSGPRLTGKVIERGRTYHQNCRVRRLFLDNERTNEVFEISLFPTPRNSDGP